MEKFINKVRNLYAHKVDRGRCTGKYKTKPIKLVISVI